MGISTASLELSPNVSRLIVMKVTVFFLSGLLILTGCSSSISEESATTLPTPKPSPTCTNREFLDQLSVKKINRNSRQGKSFRVKLNQEQIAKQGSGILPLEGMSTTF